MGTQDDRLLGIDLGTSSCKAGVVTCTGQLLGLGIATYHSHHPLPEAAEQDPEDWWAAVCAAVQSALRAAAVDPVRIGGIGLSGQIPTLVAAFTDGRPLRPALTWQDGRGTAHVLNFSRHDLGITLPPSHSWPASRLQWLRAAEPDVAARAGAFLMAKDWLYLRLTGRLATDASSWRGLIHLETGAVSPVVADSVGWALDRIPQVTEPTDCTAVLLPEAATAIGLLPSTPVAVGWNDAWCNLLGSGVVEPGLGFDICGTSELAGLVLSQPAECPGLIAAPFYGGMHLLYGPTQAGGSSLAWFADLHGVSAEQALRNAGEAPAGPRG